MSDPDAPPDPPAGSDPRTDPFRRLAEKAPIGMVAARPDGTVEFANRRWREITGIDHPTPIPYSALAPVLHPDDRDGLVTAVVNSGRQGEEFEISARVVRADGVRHVLAHGAPIMDEDGTLTGFVGTASDVTDLFDLV